jgi:hypothetical protein
MDDDTAELITQRCTRIGMIIEDVSDVALTLGKANAEHRAKSLRQLERASEQINCLVQAVLVLEGGTSKRMPEPRLTVELRSYGACWCLAANRRQVAGALPD